MAAERERYRSKCRRRRVLQRASTEPYTLAEIAARDRYRCGLCRKKVDMRLIDGRLPMAPTVDHVIPISEGGTDTKANVQLAHRICNLRKGKRGTPQQLRLVG
jgi:5-methylcytosine-specific restriction endonuclease McrA